ncbi:MAG: hypothetical protein RSC68_14775 [Acinetobacter sp.]
MKEWLKTLIRILLVLALYAVVTMGLLEFSRDAVIKNAIMPPQAADETEWFNWVQRATLTMACISFGLYIVYQILTCKKLLGGSNTKDPLQHKIGLLNMLCILAHLLLIGYFGFYLRGYGTVMDWLFSIGFTRNYSFLFPIPVYTLLYWLSTRLFANSCVFRYKRWQLIR